MTIALNGLPCLLLKPLRTPGAAFCQQFVHFRVGERPARHLAEHGQGAVRVVAAHHLAVELHRTLAALGAGTVRCLVPEQLVRGKQFRGDFPWV